VTARLSLRTKATLIGTALFALVLVAGSILLISTLESRLVASSDQLSRSRVVDLLDLARTGDLPPALTNVDDDGMAQVVGSTGEVIAASPNLEGRGAVTDRPTGPDPAVRTFEAPDDQETETYRVWSAAGPSPDGTVHVHVGSSLESVAEASSALRRALWVGVPVTVVLLGVLIWLLLGRTLGRLDRIRADVDRISAENLHARLDGDGADDEVGRLAATMNAMLDRLDRSAQQQRDFVADVSHDLQSPLAAQRVALELALSSTEGVDVGRMRSDVLGPTSDMERLVRDLLVLAELDADAGTHPSGIDLDEIVLEEATRARAGSEIRIDTAQVSAAPAHADLHDTRRIVRNLLDNAVTYAATRLNLVVDLDGDRVRLDVIDDGPGIPAEHHEKVFDRFYRADTARARGSGSGLGLAIARGLAERNGGNLVLLESSTGAHLRLLLPAHPPTPETCPARSRSTVRSAAPPASTS
jgi:signal transduction histidine kinase